MVLYNRIFIICNEQENTVHEILQNNELNLTFRRYFGLEEIEEWQQLLDHINNVQLTDEPDTIT